MLGYGAFEMVRLERGKCVSKSKPVSHNDDRIDENREWMDQCGLWSTQLKGLASNVHCSYLSYQLLEAVAEGKARSLVKKSQIVMRPVSK